MRAVTRELLVFFVLISTIAVLGALAVEHVEPTPAGATTGNCPEVHVTLGGVRLGWPKSLAQARLQRPRNLVAYEQDRVSHVDGVQLETSGHVALKTRQTLDDAIKLLGPPDHAGFVDGDLAKPALRFNRHCLTVFVIPGTRLIAAFHMSENDDVKRRSTRP